MLAGITKIGSKTLIHIDALEALYSQLSSPSGKKKNFLRASGCCRFPVSRHL